MLLTVSKSEGPLCARRMTNARSPGSPRDCSRRNHTRGGSVLSGMHSVAELLEDAVAQWRSSDTVFPEFARRFTRREQAEREAELTHFLECIEAEVAELPRVRSERDRTRERITTAFTHLAKSALEMEDRHLQLLLRDGFSGIGTSLAREARRFDPSVSANDILQACRNAWTACGLQVLLGRSMCVTPSIFAYSMLYPYSDNYLDDPGITHDEKVGFNRRFGMCLAGEKTEPANAREGNIWRLVGRIESEYPRSSNPEVFASLLAIHRAQNDSLRLARRDGPAGDVDVLKLSFAKGGTSVLADGYLAAGTLTADEARFIYLWGVTLQLGDDLQDVREDSADGMLTLFSQAAGNAPLDAITNRAFHLGERVMGLLNHTGAAESGTLKELIRRSSRSFLIRCASEAGEYYTKEYLARLELYSPFRFSFLNQQRKRFVRRQSIFTRLFEAFLTAEEDEPAFPLLPNALMPKF